MRVAICGGGVIGACLAYELGRRGAEAVVIESTGVGHAASGKSGGFLALDWCRGTPLDTLARRSFALHAEWAERLGHERGADWGYRRLETLGVVASERRDLRDYASQAAPAWVGAEAAVHARLGGPATTAQIDPGAFTRAMLDAAVAEGARLVEGRVTGVSFDGRRASGVTVEGAGGVDPEGAGIIAADAVVIAMGPWSLLASQWLPLPPVYGLKGHSFVLQSSEAIPAQALFVEYEAADGQSFTPEIVPRADGTTYVCGVSSQSPLPLDPAAVAADAGAHERLLAMTARIAPGLGRAAILKTQTCFRPVTVDGLPFIGAVPGVPGAFVATGHSVWGMLNAPATAEALAGLIVEGKSGGVALSAFDPARMEPMAAGART